jgi:predicted metal-dependent phosphoesterase TrpH
MGTKQGDILGLFVEEVRDTRDPYEFVESVKAQGGVAILAHPFTKHLTIEKKLCEMLHGAEGFNARHAARDILPDGSFGEKHIAEFAKEYNLTLTGGSDAHFYWEVGRGRTIIPAMTLEEVKTAIIRGNTLAVGKRSSGLFQLLSGMVHASKWFHPEFRRGGRRKKKHGPPPGDAPQSETNPSSQGD